MYFYYKNKYENKSKDNEYLPKNFNLTNLKNIVKTFSWCSLKVMMVKSLFLSKFNRCPPSHN